MHYRSIKSGRWSSSCSDAWCILATTTSVVNMATFSLNLQRRVEPGLTACGKFDGTHACLAAATSAGNVLIHSPHRDAADNQNYTFQADARLNWSGELAELQIGRQVCPRNLNIYIYKILFLVSHSIIMII